MIFAIHATEPIIDICAYILITDVIILVYEDLSIGNNRKLVLGISLFKERFSQVFIVPFRCIVWYNYYRYISA